jgi:hypothetical protein
MGYNFVDGCDISAVIDIDLSDAGITIENVNIQKLPRSLTRSIAGGALD